MDEAIFRVDVVANRYNVLHRVRFGSSDSAGLRVSTGSKCLDGVLEGFEPGSYQVKAEAHHRFSAPLGKS